MTCSCCGLPIYSNILFGTVGGFVFNNALKQHFEVADGFVSAISEAKLSLLRTRKRLNDL